MGGYIDPWEYGGRPEARQPEAPGPDGICRTFLAVWGCWLAYLAIWVGSSWTELPEDGFVKLLESTGMPPVPAMYLTGLLELAGGMLWALAGAGLMRLACWFRYNAKCRGDVPEPAKRKYRAVELPVLGLYVLGLACALYAAFLWAVAIANGIANGTGGTGLEAVIAVFMGPLAIAAGILLSGFCLAMCFLCVPITRCLCRWAEYAWRGPGA